MMKEHGWRSGRPLTTTSLANSGRIAGIGISYDNYSETSGNPCFDPGCIQVKFPNDDVKPELLNGECIVIQEGKKANNE